MLSLANLALIGFLGNVLGQPAVASESVPLLAWQEAKIFAVPTQPDPAVEAMVADYLERLAAAGFPPQQQGVWIQSEWAYLAQHQQTTAASAASLTKVATTLAALSQWQTDHRFETRIYSLGTIEDGVLEGDLIVEGGKDPLFVWEEAIAVGNALEAAGIEQINGNLIIVGDFYFNFKADPQLAGERLKQAFDQENWSRAIEQQYQSLPEATPRPQLAIAGTVLVEDSLPAEAKLLLRHQSLTLAEILKQMNIYSNNAMSEMLAEAVGGARVVAQVAAKSTDIPPGEIQLINGSGLGVENRLSPRAAANLFIALEEKLTGSSLTVADLFPVAGRDKGGTMQWRGIPDGIAVKTGTLAQVSALAGVIPTEERGTVWFTILNQGNDIEKLRAEQDKLLQRLAQRWQLLPVAIDSQEREEIYLGDPRRNQITIN